MLTQTNYYIKNDNNEIFSIYRHDNKHTMQNNNSRDRKDVVFFLDVLRTRNTATIRRKINWCIIYSVCAAICNGNTVSNTHEN